MAGDGVGSPSSPLQQIIRALSEIVSAGGTEKEKALFDECKQSVARGEDKPADRLLLRFLVCAISRGNGSLVDEALRLGAAASSHDDSNSGEAVLVVAAYYGKEDIVSMLLGAGVVKDGLHYRSLALKMASSMGRVGVVKVLLADTDASLASSGGNSMLRSAFEIAAEDGHEDVMRVLLQQRVGKSAFAVEINTKLFLAVYGRRTELIDFLVEEAGADVNARDGDGRTPLHHAGRGFSEAVATLLRHRATVDAVDKDGKTPLFEAARHDKLLSVDFLVAAGADVNATDGDGRTPLHHAGRGSSEAVATLLRHRAIVDAVDKNGATPLFEAIRYDKLLSVDVLVAAGADVNASDGDGKTPLHHAGRGSSEAVATLIRHRAIVDAVDKDGATPLFEVVRYDKFFSGSFKHSAFEALADAGANINHRNHGGLSLLDMTAIMGSVDILAALVERKVDVHAVGPAGFSPLHFATSAREKAAIESLIAAGADVNARTIHGEMTPLHIAVAHERTTETHCSTLDHAPVNGEMDFLGTLVRHGADIHACSEEGYTALHYAANCNQARSIDFLVDTGVDVHAKDGLGYTPLHVASLHGSTEAVTALLKHGADKECILSDGRTPLQLAAKGGTLSVVEALASAGADVNRRDQNDTSALDLAAGEGHTGVLEALIRHGADVKGDGALYKAAKRDKVTAIRVLLAAGALVNGPSQEWTPLDSACKANAAGAVAFLAEHGADLSNINIFGLTPLQYAVQENYSNVVNVLLSAGADPNQEDGENWVIYTAVSRESKDILAALLLHGADVNKKNLDGWTALHIAVDIDVPMIDYLINAGANVNARNGVDERPIHLACAASNIDIVLTLMERGANVIVRDYMGRTPLHIAALSCVRDDWNVRRVDLLLRAGADETALDDNDHTPAELIRLHYSSESRYEDSLARVTRALECAPADRAWRRRGTVLMCRAFSAERKAEQLDPVGTRGMVDGTQLGGDSADDDTNGGDFGCLMSRLFALEEGGLFRTVVSFL